jgi:hypothetical protein
MTRMIVSPSGVLTEALGFEALNRAIGGLLGARRFYYFLDDAATGILTPEAVTLPGVRSVISVISATRAEVLMFTGGGAHWRIADTPEVFEAFLEIARDPVFGG